MARKQDVAERDHLVDSGKGGVAGPTPEDGTGAQAQTVKDLTGPQIDWPP